MIPAPPAITAQYDHYPRHRRVVAFDTGGHALIVGSHELERACDLPGFEKLVDHDDDAPIAILPARGMSLRLHGMRGEQWHDPLIAWLVTADGAGTALAVDGQGNLEPIRTEEYADVKLEHDAA
jgi:hypothetical protein